MTILLVAILVAVVGGTQYAFVLRARAEAHRAPRADGAEFPPGQPALTPDGEAVLSQAKRLFRLTGSVTWGMLGVGLILSVIRAFQGMDPWTRPVGVGLVVAGLALFAPSGPVLGQHEPSASSVLRASLRRTQIRLALGLVGTGLLLVLW